MSALSEDALLVPTVRTLIRLNVPGADHGAYVGRLRHVANNSEPAMRIAASRIAAGMFLATTIAGYPCSVPANATAFTVRGPIKYGPAMANLGVADPRPALLLWSIIAENAAATRESSSCI